MADINSYIKEERAQGLKSADSRKTARENAVVAGLRTELLGGKRIVERSVGSSIKVKKRLPIVLDVIAGILMLVLVLAVIVGSYMLFRYFSNDYDGVNVEYEVCVRVDGELVLYQELVGRELFMDVEGNSVYFGRVTEVESLLDPGSDGSDGGRIIITVQAGAKHRDGEGYSIGDSRLAVGSKYDALYCGETSLYNVLVTALSVEGE